MREETRVMPWPKACATGLHAKTHAETSFVHRATDSCPQPPPTACMQAFHMSVLQQCRLVLPLAAGTRHRTHPTMPAHTTVGWRVKAAARRTPSRWSSTARNTGEWVHLAEAQCACSVPRNPNRVGESSGEATTPIGIMILRPTVRC